jgi:hypothetical protein
VLATRREDTLEFLLGFDGRIHHLEGGYWLKFEIRKVDASPQRPHGLAYSFTCHGPDGRRLVGFDNAHKVRERGSRFKVQSIENDHWHRSESDTGSPYDFTDAEQLLLDFESAVEKRLKREGIGRNVIAVSEVKKV